MYVVRVCNWYGLGEGNGGKYWLLS
jgi:hypothetical protein